MSVPGLGLGQIPLSAHSSYPLVQEPDEIAAPAAAEMMRPGAHADETDDAPAALFALVSGEIARPLRQRSGLPTVMLSSVAHGVLFGGLFIGLALSQGIVLPKPQETARLVAMLMAPPPPPPPAPAAPAPAAAAAAAPGPAETRPTPTPDVAPELAVQPQVPLSALNEISMPNLAPPPKVFFGPSMNTGLGSGFGGGSGSGGGQGFGVDGGVGWGTGASGEGGPVRVGGAIETPELIHRVEPVYPPEAAASRVEGTVVLEATVDESGTVLAARVLRSIGPLDEAAIAAVMQWRYSPLRVGDQPAQFVVTVNVSFRLR